MSQIKRKQKSPKNKLKPVEKSARKERSMKFPSKKRFSKKLKHKATKPIHKKRIAEEDMEFDIESSSEETPLTINSLEKAGKLSTPKPRVEDSRPVSRPRVIKFSGRNLKRFCSESESDSSDSTETEQLAQRMRIARQENMRLMRGRMDTSPTLKNKINTESTH